MSSFSFDDGSNEPKATIGEFSCEVLTELTALQEEKVMENRVEADKTQCIHAAHVAQTPSGCAHHRSEKATELLSDEHRVIERVLVVLEKLATRRVEKSLDCWKKALDFFSHFADQCHHFKEERVLSAHGGTRHTERRRSNRYDADGTRRGKRSCKIDACGDCPHGDEKRSC